MTQTEIVVAVVLGNLIGMSFGLGVSWLYIWIRNRRRHRRRRAAYMAGKPFAGLPPASEAMSYRNYEEARRAHWEVGVAPVQAAIADAMWTNN